MEGYLMFILCTFLTLVTLGVLMCVVYISWVAVIEPIMDRVKEQKELEYKALWIEADDERIDLDRKLRRIGFDDDFISCIDPCCGPKISKEYKDENTRYGYMNVMVKFSILEGEYNKCKEKQEKIFRGERRS
jgi:hypothetical protein